ncbi:MAG: helix-turn-helix transcriptional regulator [Alphaproteobacteria bacterium]|nr:helix-turn-helix transcriptional regulator [Alphaproteobacteria bacterium]
MMISSEQIKAARAWMDWTREMLAEESGVSPGTIRNLEEGKLSHRSVEPVRIAFESRGFKFHGRNGISRQAAETKTFDGPHGCDEFYDELLSMAQRKGGEIVAIFRTQEQFARALGIADFNRLERLEQLAKHATVKCLLSEDRQLSMDVPSMQFRATSHNPLGPLAQIICNDTTIVVITNGRDFFFHLTKSIETAHIGLNDFEPRWESAVPLIMMPQTSKTCA